MPHTLRMDWVAAHQLKWSQYYPILK